MGVEVKTHSFLTSSTEVNPAALLRMECEMCRVNRVLDDLYSRSERLGVDFYVHGTVHP